jgi:hypothetical protein
VKAMLIVPDTQSILPDTKLWQIRPCSARPLTLLRLIDPDRIGDASAGRIPKIRPAQLRISGLVGASTCCRGAGIKDNGVLSPIAL